MILALLALDPAVAGDLVAEVAGDVMTASTVSDLPGSGSPERLGHTEMGMRLRGDLREGIWRAALDYRGREPLTGDLSNENHRLLYVGTVGEEGADYLFLGHLFDTISHPGETPLGLDAYREAALRARVPVVGIGGISGENVRLVAQAGGDGAAAIGACYNVQDPAATARAFRAAFGA